ncbi:MAG: hypothetical protein JJU28_22950 [Cyclobacteriaceae bacterium]|nr:hypothetical protein [Cyclobacteriaceae bacterium]
MKNYIKFAALVFSGIALGTLAGKIAQGEMKTKRNAFSKVSSKVMINAHKHDKEENEESVHYFI